jgi:broad specificity phosphatase PhoE
MTVTRVILVRHGETEHNRGQLTLGRADVALNQRGREQARALATSFVRVPDAVATSPLVRARDTAQAIADATRSAITLDDALIEMDVGEMEHLTGLELRERHPEFLRLWLSPECGDARMPGGETLREVQDRAWAAIQRLAAAHPGGEVVAVTHNFVILTTICRALGLPVAEFRRVRHGIAARSVIELGERGATVVRLNEQAHLFAAGHGSEGGPREARP